jgi:hypothetical protein
MMGTNTFWWLLTIIPNGVKPKRDHTTITIAKFLEKDIFVDMEYPNTSSLIMGVNGQQNLIIFVKFMVCNINTQHQSGCITMGWRKG